MTRCFAIVLLSVTTFITPTILPQTIDAVVYSGRAFQLYAKDALANRSIPCDIPVGSFSVAPNARFIVFASTADAHAEAGLLFRLDLQTKQLKRLASRPAHFRKLDPGEMELYALPEISPDSQFVAFAIRAVAGNASDDTVGLAGPVAVMNIDSGKTRILSNTENIDGNGPAYIGSLAWSPGGHRLLMAFEITGGFTDLDGKGLRVLDGLLPERLRTGQYSPLAWWTNNDVMFMWSANQLWSESAKAMVGKLFSLNLDTGKLTPASDFLTVSPDSFNTLIGLECNRRYVLLHRSGRSELFTRTGGLVQTWPTSNVRLASN